MAKTDYNIKLGLIANQFKAGINDARTAVNGFARGVKSAMGMIAGAFAAGQIKAFANECVNAFKAQQIAETKLATVMQQRMKASDDEVKSIMKLTSAQQQLGVIGDEVQIAGAQQIATFLNEKSSLDKLIPAMNNLLAQQKGLNATQGDAVSVGNLLGKAMQGQVGALSKVGITFSEAEANVLKFGTEEQKAAILSQVITNNVGDMNAALAETDLGKIQQMENILGDLKEQIGGAIAPIVAELAPMVATVATGLADNVTAAIGVIKENIAGVVTYIVGQVAGIKLVQYVTAFVAKFKANNAKIAADAEMTAQLRLRAEEKLKAAKDKLLVLEAQEEEATGAKKLQIAQRVAAQKRAIKNQEVALEKAKNAEVAANNALNATKSASAWKRGMLMARASVTGFVASAKAAFRSFVPLLVFEALFNVITLVVKKLYESSEGFRNLVSLLKNTVVKAVETVAHGLGVVIDKIAELFGLEKSGGGKAAAQNMAKKAASITPGKAGGTVAGPPGNAGGTGAGRPLVSPKGTVVKELSDYEQALKSYKDSIVKADAELKVANITVDDYDKRMLDIVKDAQVSAELAKPKSDAEKKLIDAWKQELAAARVRQEVMQGVSVEGKPLDKAALDKTQKGRDRTFDYKKGKGEIVIADLDLDLSNAKARLEELNRQAQDGCTKAAEMIDDAMKDVTSLSDALRMEQLKQDIEEMKEDLNKTIMSGVQGGWEGIKNTVSDVTSLVEKLKDPDVSGWEKFASIMDSLFNLLNNVQQIMEAINTVQKISNTLTTAGTALKRKEAVASSTDATAKGGEAIAGATASGASMPFPYNLIAIAAGIAAVVSALATTFSAFSEGGVVGKGGRRRFSSGGLVSGSYPTGDMIPSLLNSNEMVLNTNQQNKLFKLANAGSIGNGMGGKVEFEISARTLKGVLKNDNTRSSKLS